MVNRPRRGSSPGGGEDASTSPAELRIIGGRFRGRRLVYSGDPRTRPMKDRVREALFNLVGAYVPGKHAVDLFAGTGALGLEALSRGAARSTLIERHFPTAALIRQNIATLGCQAAAEVIASDTFFWARRPELPTAPPWMVFCSPPWSLFTGRGDELMDLLARLIEAAPPESWLIVEAHVDFDPARLPRADQWRVRDYPPARLATLRIDGPGAA